MIYLVTKKQELFTDPDYTIISEQKALEKIKKWDVIQFDTETSGRDPHICHLLCAQFGNDTADERIVVDCETINIELFKEVLENKLLIGQNLKFDLQFLYNHNIIPLNVYDTMIVEQVLYLGYPVAGKPGGISYALNAIAIRRLNTNIDKTVRGEIIWRGLDKSVIMYAAGDVMYLEKIRDSQLQDCQKKDCLKAADVENSFVPAISYLEWCGIRLDEEKWKQKMAQDQQNLKEATDKLNQFLVDNNLLEYYHTDLQGDLFEGFSNAPVFDINWSSSQQVVKVAKRLGFNTATPDKKTGEDKDTVLEKHLKTQKGINDEFLKLYFDYQEYAKVVSSFGQGHLDAINPITGRLHSTFKQLGASSGRLSSGSTQSNEDLARYKKIRPSRCKYPNLQQLPADDATRGAFVAPKGSLMVSADFSAEESRLAADIYQDKEFFEEFVHRSGDMHSLFAWVVFRKECEACGCKGVEDVKRLAPQWRKVVKGVEFGYLFGAAAKTLSETANCTEEQAQKYLDDMNATFTGVSTFASKGARFVRAHGYIVINPDTGHKLYWWDWEDWKQRQQRYNQPGFWDEYKVRHKGTGDAIALEVRQHFQAAGKYDRLARNVVTQGTGAIILKTACCNLFKWIVENNYFNKVHLCCLVHDEIVCDYPEELSDFPKILEHFMEEAAAIYCKSLPIPAEASVGDHWIH